MSYVEMERIVLDQLDQSVHELDGQVNKVDAYLVYEV